MLLGALAVLNIRAAEVYTHFDPETGVLMYYYDNLRTSRGGTNELYDPNTNHFEAYYNLVTKAVIHSSMKNAPLTSTRNMFFGGKSWFLSKMTTIEGLENLNTANVTDMSQMFFCCKALTSLDLSSFNVAKVTNMSYMFLSCEALTSLDLRSFNITKVTTTMHMFSNCSKLKTIYCGYDWSTSSTLTNSSYMFEGCRMLLGGEGTSYIKMSSMDKTYARPDGGTSKPGYFTQPFDKSKEVYTHFNSSTGVVTYYYDSQRASRGGTTELYNPDQGDPVHFVSYWDKIVKIVIDPSMKDAPLTSMRNMFFTNGTYNEFLSQLTSIEGLEYLRTVIVRDMSKMFYGCKKLTSLDLSSFNTANVTTMEMMFQSCEKLTMLDLSMFDIGEVTIMNDMFRGCESLTTIYCDDDWSASTALVSSFDMFYNCKALVGGKGTKYNSSEVRSYYARPDGGTSSPGYFTLSSEKPVVFTQYSSNTLTYYYGNMAAHSGWNKELYDPTSTERRFVGYSENILYVVIDESMKNAPLTSTRNMFWGGTGQELINLTTIEGLENLNTANVTDMVCMFNRCKRLTTLDLSSFDVSKVTVANYMFRGCESLTTIYCDDDWSTSTVMTQSYGMFQDCTSLVGGKGTKFDSSIHYSLQNKSYARPDGGTSKPGYFTSTTEPDPVTITAKSYTREYGEENPTFGYDVEGAALEGTPAISCAATKTSPVGVYPIVITKGSVTNENDTYVNGTLTIKKAPLTIDGGTYTMKQGEALPEFTATYTGFKNNETEDVLTTMPSLSTTATSDSEPDEYEVVVSGAEAENYEISYVYGTLTITEADAVTLTANSYTREYGEENPEFGFTSEGAVVEGAPSITCEATATSPAGTYPIVITKGSVTNYNDSYVNGTLTITKAPLTVSVADAEREEGEENPEFVISYSGWKNGETEDVLTVKPTATTDATKDSPVGEYVITVSGGEAKNYELTYVAGTLTVKASSGILPIINDNVNVNYYSLDGRKLQGKPTQKGVYIQNGRKIVR